MGFGDITGKTTKGFGGVATTKKTSSSMEDYLSVAQQQGEQPKEKVGTLTRLFNVLSAFEPGGELATYFRTGDVGKAGKQYVSEVGRGLGSALPFLDPYTKPKELSAEREGFSEALEAGGWKPTTTAGKIAKGGAGLAGDIFLDPGNVLLAPLFKTLFKGAKGVGKIGAKALAKTEKGQDILKAASGSKELLGEAFKTGYKVKKVSPELVDITEKLKRAMNVGDEEAVGLVKKLVDKHGLGAIKKAPYEIEKGGKLSKVSQDVADLIKSKTAREIPLGVRAKDIEDYFPRKVVKEPSKGFAGGLPEIKPTLKGAEKGRVFETLAEGEKAGYKYLEAPESLSLRLATSQRAVKAKGALNQMVAGEIKDLAGNSIVRQAGEAGTQGMREFTKIKELGGYVAHPDVVDYLENVQKIFTNDETTNSVLKIYDKIQNIWKGSVTSYFPAFHTRNAIGNIFNNFVAGVKNPISYTDAGKLQKGKGKLTAQFKKLFPEAETFEDARKLMAELGVTGKGQFAEDVPELFRKTIGKEGLAKKLVKAPRRVGNVVEDNARIAHFVEKIKGGAKFDEASKSVNKFLFDYSDVTPFERNVMKRIFPFYTFSRKNIPMQLEQIFKQPKKYKAIGDAISGLQSGDLTPEEKRYMPDYITEKFGISVGKSEKGYPQMLAGLGLPLEDVSKAGKPLKALLDMATPLLKTPTELATGKSLFYGSDIRDTSAYNATTKAIGGLPILKQLLEAKPAKSQQGDTYYKVNPKRMYLLKAIAGRFVGTGEKLTDVRKDIGSRLLNVLTGVKIYTPDIEREKEKQIMEMLKELGVTKTFTKDYIPKKKGGFGT